MKYTRQTIWFTSALISLFTGFSASAADFTVNNGVTETTTQTIGAAAGETGLVAAGGAISVTGNNTPGAQSDSANGRMTNNGNITTNGSSSYGMIATAVNNTMINAGTLVTNGFNAPGMAGSAAGITMINSGTLTINGFASEGMLSTGIDNIMLNSGTLITVQDQSKAMASTNDGVVMRNTGSIVTSGTESYGMWAGGLDAMMVNSGTIETSGLFAPAMRSQTAGTTVINNGSLITHGMAEGMYITATDNYVENNGTIEVDAYHGIFIDFGDNTIINNGSITTHSSNYSAIRSQSTNNTVTNNGIITTTGSTAYGLYSHGSGGNITNNGSIATSGANSHAMITDANSQSITNNGSITTSTASAYGMAAVGASSVALTNNGVINVTGSGNHAMHSDTNSNTLINNGRINFSGGIFGISSAGNNETLTNNGSMEVRFGIASNGTNNTLTNNGTILSRGILGGGLSEAAAGNTSLVNNGTIIATGDTSYGLKGVQSNTLVNNGRIKTTGYGLLGTGDSMALTNRGRIDNADSIGVTGNNNTITLGMNSYARGNIAIAGTNNTVLYDLSGAGRAGGAIHVGGAITGASAVNLANAANVPGGAKIAQGGNTVAVVMPDQFSGSQRVITQTVSDAGNLVNNRQQLALLGDTAEASDGTQYAASTATMSDATDPDGWALRDRKVAWAEAFGSYQERGADGNTASSEAMSGGALAGVDFPQTDDGVRTGFYAGGFAGNLDVGENTFRKVDSAGGMAGGYIGKSYGEYYVSAQLGAGFSNNDSRRYTGVDTASADYTSYFVTPSLTVMRPSRGDGVTWVPSATLRYTAQFDDSYNEGGSVVNQNVDSRRFHSLEARLMLEAKLDAMEWKGSRLKPSLRAGLQGQTLLGGSQADLQTLGTNMSFDPRGGDNHIDGILGANMSYMVNSQLDFYGDAEGNLGLNKGGPGNNQGITGRIGARWKL